MSLALPQNPELRAMYDVASLVDFRSLPTFRQTLAGCRNMLANTSAAKSAQGLAIRADGEIWLIQVSRSGSWKKLWNFGNPI
jgi:hypothetical protein